MPASVVGRDLELTALNEFLARLPDGAAALVLEGDAGMGKTTLWRAAVDRAEETGLVVLRAQPAESETALSFSGLGDLLDPVLEAALAPLPAGQRAALSRALVLEDAPGPPPDAHAVGVAVLNALRALAGERTVLVGIDDVQWLDAASAAALGYAARRLRTETVGVLLARRVGLESGLLDEMRRAMSADCVALEVGPLDVDALHQVVQVRLGVALPRPLLAEVHQASGGNPFFALEIVRSLSREGVSVEAGRPLPVPNSLRQVVHDRLLALPGESRHFLSAAAAHAHPTVAITEAASGVAGDVGLGPALHAQIVELDRDRIRFTHPLLAAGAYETASPVQLRSVHIRLADLLTDPEARAWQLAAATDEPDEGVAAVLEEAAEHSRARGALRPAALLLDRAAQLTPRDYGDDGVRRAVEAAFLHFEAGDAARAEAQALRVVERLAPGHARATALWVLARIRTYDAPADATAIFERVAEEAGDDRELLAAAHEGIASSLFYALTRLPEALQHAAIASSIAEEIGDEALAADVLVTQLGVETLLGLDVVHETADRALALQGATVRRRVLDQPLVSLAERWMLIDEHERAREALAGLLLRADELGDEASRPYLLFFLGSLDVTVGRLEEALARAREGIDAAEQSGQRLFAAYNFSLAGLVLARLGRDGETLEAIRRARELMPATGWAALVAPQALTHLELARGNAEAVVSESEDVTELVRREEIVEPSALAFLVDRFEALVELGRHDAAVELLGWYEGNARRLARISALANCARCRGLLSAQSGDVTSAIARYREALEWYAQVELPLDRGRTLLALGVTQRRMKHRREARATLEEALALFERIGAALWAERARVELKRISGRAATPGALTPAEQRVATLAAAGKTNKEVAAALFLSDRTVEGHLAHVFGKLGIRHRGELAGALQTQGIPLPNTGDSPVSTESTAP